MPKAPERRRAGHSRRPRRRLDQRVSASGSDLGSKVRRPRGAATRADHDSRHKLQRDLSSAYEELRATNESLLHVHHELEETRDHYLDLYDFAPVAYATLDPVGVVTQINLAGCRLFGYDRQHLIGRPLIGIVHANDKRAFLAHMLRCRQEENVVESELQLQTRDRRVITVRLFSKRSLDHRRVLYRTILIDQTERIALERAHLRAEHERELAERERQLERARSEAKDRFLAMLSHELRTPLTPALFAATMLTETPGLPERSGKLVRTIRRSIELEARLIDDLLDVTRISRGTLQLRPEIISVHDLLHELVTISDADPRAEQLTIGLDLRATAFYVNADPTRLRQVFWNLLNNAIKFSDDGGRIVVRTMNDESGNLCVSVSDTGVGIEPDTIAKLFTPFEQTDAPRPRGGLGLGLTICKGIVEAHGGRIWATSRGPGSGATVEVELATVPRDSAVDPVADNLSPPENPGLESRPLRILLVEDDLDTGSTLSMFLSQQGHAVTMARSVRSALAKADKQWDVVISDIGLPDGTGMELAREIIARSPRPTTLIALSGYGSDRDLEASKEAGFDDHLVKPLDFGVLLATIRQRNGG